MMATRTVIVFTCMEESRQDWRPLLPDGIEGVRIQAQDFQDRGRHLSGFHKTVDGTGLDQLLRSAAQPRHIYVPLLPTTEFP